MTRSGLILTLTIAIQSIFLWIGCGQLSPTPDEFAHLAAGIEYWHTGSLDLYNVNPPLTKLWISLPAVFEGAIVPTIPLDERYNLDARYEFTRGRCWLLPGKLSRFLAADPSTPAHPVVLPFAFCLTGSRRRRPKCDWVTGV